MIKKIQNDVGVRIQFKLDDGISLERVVQVMGFLDWCQYVVYIISELIFIVQERDGFGGLVVVRGRGCGCGDWSVGVFGGVQEIIYMVLVDKCGFVIGKGGENIKSINQQLGVYVEFQRNFFFNSDFNLWRFIIRGVFQQIEVVRQFIDEKVGGINFGVFGVFGQSLFSQLFVLFY